MLVAKGKDVAGGSGTGRAAEGAAHGSEPVEGAENAERGARVGEQNRGRGKRNDDAKGLEHHNDDDGGQACVGTLK